MKILFFNPEPWVDFEDESTNVQARVPILNCGLPISHEDYVYQRVLRMEGPIAMNRGAVEAFKSFKPDVVFNSQSWGNQSIDAGALNEIRNLGGKVITVMWDTGDNYQPERAELVLASDLVLIGDSISTCMQYRAWCEALGRQNNVLFTPVFNNGNVFFRQNLEKIYDVAFIGSLGEWREAFVEYLEAEFSKSGINFLCTGGNFGIEGDKIITAPNRLNWSEYVRTINQTKIGISVQSGFVKAQSKTEFSVNKGRPFDFLACGTFCLSDPTPDLQKIIPEGCIAYFDSPKDCVRTAMHFLEHEADREAIAKQGYEWFREFYDYRSLWQSVLKFVVHGEGHLPTVPVFEQEYKKFKTLLPSISRSQLSLLNTLSRLVCGGEEIKHLSVKLQEIIDGHYLFNVDERHLVISDHHQIDFIEIGGQLHAHSPQFGLFELDDSTLFTNTAQKIMTVANNRQAHQAVAMIKGQKEG